MILVHILQNVQLFLLAGPSGVYLRAFHSGSFLRSKVRSNCKVTVLVHIRLGGRSKGPDSNCGVCWAVTGHWRVSSLEATAF